MRLGANAWSHMSAVQCDEWCMVWRAVSVTEVCFTLNRWDYWESSGYHESQKCPVHCDIHGTPAITSKIPSCTSILIIMLHFMEACNFNFNDSSLQVISETSMSNQAVGRSLLQEVTADVKAPIMFNSTGGPCIMLWAQNLNVSLSRTSAFIDLAAQTPTLTGSVCNGSHSQWDDRVFFFFSFMFFKGKTSF